MEVMEATVRSCRNTREKLFEELYVRAFPGVARFVSKMNGSFQDAKDIFHDALVIDCEKHEEQSFTITALPEAYILGIAKHLWIKKFNKDHSLLSLDETASSLNIPEDYFPSVNSSRLLVFLERAGKKCLDLLRAFYYEKLPGKNIVQDFGYQNEHSATVQKYKCLEKVRDSVKEKSIRYEDFLE